ncbi:MAG: LPS export ABC transporter periplasmic protein LptC [Nitrospina sp.]|jgi:LPS export ABC transporter protein LptC|nr:LPS export ABC transporter periplasmic protein LptC [Nitrospina sp.]MBT6718375.1 LPS export ABC transporter periplasmic protein LptC [Nitrospina sp.]
MINAVRIILLIIAFGVISLAGFYFYTVEDNKVEMGNVKIKIMEKGVDVEIENFKVTHEVKGKKEWILKAGLAQINNQEDVTRLKDVEMILPKENNNPYVITAESGTYKNSSKDIDLVGQVKLRGDSQSLVGRFQADKDEPASTKLSK